jgi:3-oxoacyl-[acyl-carrier-protein] synthase II
MNMKDIKTVITGLGTVTSLGKNAGETWKNVVSGKSGVRRITSFDTKDLETKIAAEVNDDFEEDVRKILTPRQYKKMTRATRMALLSAHEAISDSGVDFNTYDRQRVGIILGVIDTAYNDNEKAKSELHSVVKKMPNAPSAWISMLYGIEGANFNVSSACASSAFAIALGNQLIKDGIYDMVIAGGVDSSINYECLKGFGQIMALSINNDQPSKASRPFSKDRDGFVMGEGAGTLILESSESAEKRRAEIYCELSGYALTSEAFDITAPKTDGVGMSRTMQLALENAGCTPDDIDYINAHGTGTFLNDKCETMAIKSCFGQRAYKIPVSSTKSMIGHTFAASAAIESIVTILTMKNGIITPTINYEHRDEMLDLDYVPNSSRKADVGMAMSNSFGFGGHNASLIYKKYVR